MFSPWSGTIPCAAEQRSPRTAAEPARLEPAPRKRGHCTSPGEQPCPPRLGKDSVHGSEDPLEPKIQYNKTDKFKKIKFIWKH